LISLARKLGKRVIASGLGARCPGFYDVRWLSLYHIIGFIKKRAARILSLSNLLNLESSEENIIKDIQFYETLLLPLHLFILRVEENARKLPDVFPLVPEVVLKY
jgi:hypothetical protein